LYSNEIIIKNGITALQYFEEYRYRWRWGC